MTGILDKTKTALGSSVTELQKTATSSFGALNLKNLTLGEVNTVLAHINETVAQIKKQVTEGLAYITTQMKACQDGKVKNPDDIKEQLEGALGQIKCQIKQAIDAIKKQLNEALAKCPVINGEAKTVAGQALTSELKAQLDVLSDLFTQAEALDKLLV